jgi:DNA repair protein RadC
MLTRMLNPETCDGLNDAELLAEVLGSRTAAGVARAANWLAEAGGLRSLASASRESIYRPTGFGAARRRRLLAAIELSRRCLERSMPRGTPVSSPAEAAACFRARLGDLSHEAFACVFLDTRHRVVCFEVLFRGTIDGAPIYPREVLKRALHHNAAAVIVGHNHPSGDCEPSRADRTITLRLQQSLALLDIRLLDHLIVTGSEFRSLAELGCL